MNKIIDKLVNILNSKPEMMDETDLIVEVPSYLTFATHNASKYGFPDVTAKMDQYNAALKKSSWEKIRATLSEVQKHLIRLVNKIIRNAELKDKILLVGSLPGYHKVYLDPINEKFSMEFEPYQRLYETSSLDLKNEKELATLALVDLLLDYKIAPDQLGQCVGCGKYFYKETRHRQIYCSHSCGHTTRSRERYQKKD
jgi:hypothetical protein